MGAFKKVNTQDVYLESYLAHKNWQVSGSEYSTYGIFYTSLSEYTGSNYTLNAGDLVEGQYKPLLYKSLDMLYYRTEDTGSIVLSGSYEHYYQTSLLEDNSRELSATNLLFSIPKDYVGLYIKPGTFQISGSVVVNDNAEGSLTVLSGSVVKKVGDIIYTHGIAVVTDSATVQTIQSGSTPALGWQSSSEIYNYTTHCRFHDYEFNATLNPTIISGSLGEVDPKFLEPYFNPYITTVGLYNDANELLAVGKLSQPLPKSKDTEMTILVKFGVDF